MALGAYFLLACADDTTSVTESNEANNCLASATTVQVNAPYGVTSQEIVRGHGEVVRGGLNGIRTRVSALRGRVHRE